MSKDKEAVLRVAQEGQQIAEPKDLVKDPLVLEFRVILKGKNMKDLAPDIYRQRLLIEGIYSINVNEDTINKYFHHISKILNLNMLGVILSFSL